MENILQTHLPQIKELMLQYGVQKAYAFGSAAQGNMHAGSDVDFVIRFPENMGYETYGDNYFKLLYVLQSLLKKEVDIAFYPFSTLYYVLLGRL